MQKTKLNTFFKLAAAVLALVCTVIVVKLNIDLNELNERKALIEKQVALESEKVGELQNRLDTPFKKDFVMALAKEKLNLVMPDEVIFYNDLTE